jgi:hypothetical protein
MRLSLGAATAILAMCRLHQRTLGAEDCCLRSKLTTVSCQEADCAFNLKLSPWSHVIEEPP